MLIAEINGEPAATHPTAHMFVDEGFATTAMGLQARIVARELALALRENSWRDTHG